MSSEHSGASPEDPAKDSTLLQEAEAKNPGPSAAMRAAADPAAHDVQEELRNCFPELEMEIDLFPNDADADADADTGDHDTDDDDDGDADEDEGDEGGGVDGDADEEPVDTSLWAGLQHNDPGICGIQWTRTHVKCVMVYRGLFRQGWYTLWEHSPKQLALVVNHNGEPTFHTLGRNDAGMVTISHNDYGGRWTTLDQLLDDLCTDDIPEGWPVKLSWFCSCSQTRTTRVAAPGAFTDGTSEAIRVEAAKDESCMDGSPRPARGPIFDGVILSHCWPPEMSRPEITATLKVKNRLPSGRFLIWRWKRDFPYVKHCDDVCIILCGNRPKPDFFVIAINAAGDITLNDNDFGANWKSVEQMLSELCAGKLPPHWPVKLNVQLLPDGTTKRRYPADEHEKYLAELATYNDELAELTGDRRGGGVHDAPGHGMTDHDDGRTCRICLDGDEGSDTGWLFRPCKCKGSCGWVHTVCLDQWRSLSSNPKSAFRCDQCFHTYRFHEGMNFKMAQKLASPWIVESVALGLLFAIVFGAGTLSDTGYLPSTLRGFEANITEDVSYYASFYLPEGTISNSSTVVRRLVSGSSCVGFVSAIGSFGAYLLSSSFMMFNLPTRLMLRIMTRRGGIGRRRLNIMTIIVGLVVAFYCVYRLVKAWASLAMRRSAKYVLDVHGNVPGPAVNDRDSGTPAKKAAQDVAQERKDQ